jgi:hypothetical protein
LETIKPAQHPAAETGWLGSNSKPITVQFLGLELARFGTARQGHCCSWILQARASNGAKSMLTNDIES